MPVVVRMNSPLRDGPPGRPRPERLNSTPAMQARISGFFNIGSSSPRTLTPRSAVSAQIDITFTTGIISASIRAASASPSLPIRLPMAASPR